MQYSILACRQYTEEIPNPVIYVFEVLSRMLYVITENGLSKFTFFKAEAPISQLVDKI